MKEVALHIVAYKTGATTIQRALTNYMDAILRVASFPE